MTITDVVREASALREAGIKSILLVAGDDPNHVDLSFLGEAVEAVRRLAPSVSVEVAPLTVDGYRALAEAGAEGVTLYQETYDRKAYSSLHLDGPKSDFDMRLDALDRAGRAGLYKLTAGALLGLAPWRKEALLLGLHASRLQKIHWMSHVSIGIPRLNNVPEGFEIPHPIADRSLVHVILAMRLFMPDAGIALSTREPMELRDALSRLGVTQMSAGSCTSPGGYAEGARSGAQFETSDKRSPMEMADALSAAGFEPVFKNWDNGFHA